MAFSVDQFGKALVSAGLFTADEVKALWTAIPADARPKQGDGFAKLLVQQGKLNQFQADELLSGRNTPLVMGDYVLVAELGAGGMGKVYKARHRRMERIVALKVMSTAAMQDEAAVKRFQREVKAAARLEHPNIVTAYDSGESGKVKYLVMQFVDGGDLSQLVKQNGPLEIERAVDYVLQAARGLGFAHGEGVVHRDIKPANLLLDKKGVVKILDMGLARIEGGDGLTATEQVMGTVDYMSPEQAANTKTADGRSDIYSLGCTLWFLLTAKKVYDGDTMISRLMSHRTDPLPSLVKARDDVPWSLEQAFHKMIAKAPEDRFQSMDEVVAALEPFAPSGGSRSGMGSSIGMGPQSAEMASFLKSIGPAVKPQTKPAPSKTNVNVEATAQFAAAGADTDPKSQLLPPPKKAAQPQAKGSGKKPPPNKNLLLAAAGGGALLVLLGVWFIFRDKDGNETARVLMPEGGSVTVQQPAATAGKAPVAAATRPAVSFFLPNSTPASPSGTTSPPSVAPPPSVPSSNGVVYLDDLQEKSRFAFGGGGFKKPGRDPNAADDLIKSFPGASPVHALLFDANLTTSVERENAVPSITSHNVAARVVYDLAGKYASFQSGFRAKRAPDFIAEVWGDGKRLWESGAFVPNDAVRTSAEVDVRGVQELTLFFWSDSDSLHGAKLLLIEPRLKLVVLPSEPPTSVSGPTIAPPQAVPSSNGVVYLDDLPELEAVVGYMVLGKHGTTKGRTALSWRGSPVAHSLWMRPKVNHVSFVRYRLDGQYARFEADAGQIPETDAAPASPMTFRVFGDGRELWKSKPIAAKDDFDTVSVDVRGVQELRLETTCGSKEHLCEATWYNPRLTPVAAVSVTPTPGTKTAGTAPPPAVAPFDAAQAKAHQAAWAKHLGTTVETTNSVGQKMILIPPGEFLMGSTDEQLEALRKIAEELKIDAVEMARVQQRERPQHRVVITKPFRLSATEVTVGQFKKFVAATGYRTEAETIAPKQINLNAATDDLPTAGITWNDAEAYCKWLSEQEKTTYRLPTEAEWEFACRAGTATQYSFGDDAALLDQYEWNYKNSRSQLQSAGTKLPNGFGLFDMHGSLHEWCRDYFAANWYGASPPNDPTGPQTGSEHVTRGGNYWPYSNALQCRSAYRGSMPAANKYSFLIGFRCARELDVPAVAASTTSPKPPSPGVVSPVPKPTPTGTQPPAATGVSPAAMRWPLAPSKPEDIQWLLARNCIVTLRGPSAFGGDPLETSLKAGDAIPSGSQTVVGIDWETRNEDFATDDDLARIATFVDLEQLNFKDPATSRQITPAGMLKLAALVNLRRLAINQCKDKALGAEGILQAMPHLEFLHLPFGTNASSVWAAAAAARPSITEIKVFRCEYTDANLVHFEKIPHLTALVLSDNTALTEAAVEKLAAAKPNCRITASFNGQTRVFEPRNSPPPTPAEPRTSVSDPAGNPSLTVGTLTNTPALAAPRWPLAPSKSEDIVWLQGLKATLTLRGRSAFSDDPSDVIVNPQDPLPTKPATIVGIDFGRDNFALMSDDVLKRTATLVDLEDLNLSYAKPAEQVTKDGLPQLAALVNLRRLNLERIGPKESDPAFLERFVKLESLRLGSQPFLNWEPLMARLPALAELHLNKMDLTNLRRLGPLPRLTELGLGDYGAAEGSKRHEAAKQYAPVVPWCRITVFGSGNADPRVVIEPAALPPAAAPGMK